MMSSVERFNSFCQQLSKVIFLCEAWGSGGIFMKVDQEKLNAFLGKFVADAGASIHGPSVLIGEQLGLYKAIAAGGPLTSNEIAKKTGTNERLVREWLLAQAASGYVNYDSTNKKYWMSPEQEFTLANEDSPAYIPGLFYSIASLYRDQRKIAQAYKSGKGFGWHEHDNDLFIGTQKFFRPGYMANLVPSWLPSLEGVVSKLNAGAKVAESWMRARSINPHHGDRVSEVKICPDMTITWSRSS